MLILGIDTSGKSGGITLAEGDAQSFHALESCPIAGGTFSAQLVPTIAGLLDRRGRSVKDLAGLAAASGPGSFTGLRVGLSAVKGLAEALNKPIATVSLLEALAFASSKHGRVGTALDAGRQEIFFGLYQVSSSDAASLGESLFSQTQFLDYVNTASLAAIVTSDDSVAEFAYGARLPVPVEVAARPTSTVIASIGLRKLLAGETVSVEALDANYIRRSDAELFSKGKS